MSGVCDWCGEPTGSRCSICGHGSCCLDGGKMGRHKGKPVCVPCFTLAWSRRESAHLGLCQLSAAVTLVMLATRLRYWGTSDAGRPGEHWANDDIHEQLDTAGLLEALRVPAPTGGW